MSTVLFWFLKFIPGFSTFTNLFTQWLTNQGNQALAQIGADKDVALAQLAAETAANQAKAAVIGIPGVKWLLVAVYVPPALHAAAIVFGRMHVPYVPDVLDFLPWERDIVMSLVILVPGMTGAGALHKWASSK